MSQIRKGIVLAGGSGTRLHPLTLAVSKQLMPIYDKPMIYYPISTLMLAGIRDILIISTPWDLPDFKKLLGKGHQFGVNFSYAEQHVPLGLAHSFLIAEDFLGNSPSALVLGDNLFYSCDFTKILQEANEDLENSTIFAYEVAEPSSYGVVEFNNEGVAVSLEEKPEKPKSNFAVPGLYFYTNEVVNRAKAVGPSLRGELEITSLNQSYLHDNKLRVKKLSRGTAWLDTGTHDSLLQAAEFVRTIQQRQGLYLGCLEEIGLNQNFLTKEQFKNCINYLGNSNYKKYLETVLLKC